MDPTTNTRGAERVSNSTRIAYAMPAFALAVVGIPVYVYIPKFYTDIIGVPIGLLGTLILLVRVFDALTDPAIGFVSDRTRSRFGRRRPYIGAGSILLAIAILFLFNPIDSAPEFQTVWFGTWFFLIFLFWTLVAVPYESLGPELTFDYNERTTLFSIRDGALIAGTLLAASSPALVSAVFGLQPTPEGEREKFFWISLLFAPMVILFSWWCIFSIKERAGRFPTSTQNPLKSIRQLVSNRPFMILLVSYTIAAFGSNLPATLILYYVEYVLESNRADLFLLIYFATGIFLLPGWVVIARKIGKKPTWISAMLINTGSFIGVFFLGPGDEWQYGILVALSGIGFGATVAIPSAMQADVIDYDELQTGTRQEGHYIGVWSISKKLAAALGVGVGLAVLGAAGYEPNTTQNEEVRFTLRVLYAMIPSFCNLLALVIALFYPISNQIHEQILAAVEDRKRGIGITDPLTGQALSKGS